MSKGHRAWLMVAAALLSLFSEVASANSRYAALVVDGDSGTVLYSRYADEHRRPASLTKMMTLYMVFEAMSAGRLALDDRITVSRRAAGQPPSRLGLSVGMTIGAEHAVLALVTRSANDIATAVAEHLAASEFSFAMAMTERARALGMSRTTFRNASGLPDRGQWTTARDMSLLARALLRDFPNHYRYFAVSEFHYEGRTYRNHNTLLADDKGVDGIKTGYIRASGFNLVASALRDDRRVIGVVFGGRSAKSRDQHMRALIDTGYVALAALERSLKTTQSVASDVSSRRHWSVQVGAFSRFQTAENRAQEARSSLPELLGLAAISVAPLTSNGRTLYRARLSPLSRNAAVDVCVALQQRRFDCLPMSVSAES